VERHVRGDADGEQRGEDEGPFLHALHDTGGRGSGPFVDRWNSRPPLGRYRRASASAGDAADAAPCARYGMRTIDPVVCRASSARCAVAASASGQR
jgi:hypothetical protein